MGESAFIQILPKAQSNVEIFNTLKHNADKNKQTDLCTSDRAVTIEACASVTSIATTPAIAHMIMAPKPRAADYSPAASSPKHTPAKTPKQDPSLNHLQRDLNSPSAALRFRAMRALK